MADKFAIITGASTGIGFELAHIAAENGYDLLVVADEPLIDAAAADFRRPGIEVTAIEADLATLEGVDRLLAAAGGRTVDLLCANAGRGLGHGFLERTSPIGAASSTPISPAPSISCSRSSGRWSRATRARC
jgi:short-subunit dehydrogenase